MRVALIDYGMGNLFSVQRALETCGAAVDVVVEGSALNDAAVVVLPGVGAFADGMAELRSRGFVEALRAHAAAGRPLLGICLGMQLLATASEEFGVHEGLGVIAGRVVPVPSTTTDGVPQKVPHTGWSALQVAGDSTWTGTALDGTPPGTSVYLVHSFHLVPDNAQHRLAICDHGGHTITAAVTAGSLLGVQFHPEKSATAGLRLLTSFLRRAAVHLER